MKADQTAEESGLQDLQAVDRVLSGDPTAFDVLVRKYQRRAVSVAYRLLSNADDAGDVAQDAFVRAFKGIASLEDRRRFGPWLMRIVSNLALNYRRSRKSSSAMPIDLVPEGAEGFRRAGGQGTFATPGPEDGADVADLTEAIRRAMERLPEKQRLALTLFSIEGMSQKEVADIMECSVELVKWNVFQARKKMKELLAHFMG